MNGKKSKYYDEALRNFERARQCFEHAGLTAEWQRPVAVVRAQHRRKAGFMAGFEELVAGSGPSQKPSFLRAARRRSERNEPKSVGQDATATNMCAQARARRGDPWKPVDDRRCNLGRALATGAMSQYGPRTRSVTMHGLARIVPNGRPEPIAVTDLRIALSARADFRSSCCACPEAEIPYGALSTVGILSIVRAFTQLGVRRVRLSSGNPSTRPDLFALIAAIRRTPGIEEVAVTTSGLHLVAVTSRYREAGVTRLAVSLDTLDPVRLRRVAGRRASLPALVAGIAAATRAGFASLKLDTVVVRDVNDRELATIVRFAWRYGAVPRLIELMPWGRGEPVPVEDMKASLRRDGLHLSPDVVRGWGPAECVVAEHDRADAPRAGPIRLVGRISRERCGGCNRVRIGVDGTLRRCLTHPLEVRLGDLVRRGAGPGELLPRIREALAAR